MPAGYPDYTRLSRGGNVLLAGQGGNLVADSVLFAGYVGNFPYTTLYVNVGVVSNFADFSLIYYTDSTYTQAVGEHDSIRGSGTISACQYANLSEWMRVFIFTNNGSPYDVLWFALYGTSGYASGVLLDAANVPLIVENVTIPASTTNFYYLTRIRPGPASLFFFPAGNGYVLSVQYYDYSTGLWITTHLFDNVTFPPGFNMDIPMLDAPMRLSVDNTMTSAQQFTFSWLGK